MKKMVCEICGSQSIRKENGVFVCQECGTEYSLEEAKKLLTEVEGSNTVSSEPQVAPTEGQKKQLTDREKIIASLYTWLQYLTALEGHQLIWGLFDQVLMNPEFWQHTPDEWRNAQSSKRFTLTDDDFISGNDGDTIWVPGTTGIHSIFREGKEPFIRELLSLNRKEEFVPCTYHEGEENTFSIKSLDGGTTYFFTKKDLWDPEFDDDFLRAIFKIPPEAKLKVVVSETQTKTVQGWISSKQVKNTITKQYKYSDEFVKQIHELQKLKNDLTDWYNEVAKYVQEHMEETKEKYAILIEQLPVITEMFDLPLTYRNSHRLKPIIQILIDARADNWKEAVNIYETGKQQTQVLSSLESIKAGIDKVNSTLIEGISFLGAKLDKINSHLFDISMTNLSIMQSMNATSAALASIAKDTRFLAISSLLSE